MILEKGIVYQRGKSPARGEVKVSAPEVVRYLLAFIRVGTATMVGFAMLSFLIFFGPVLKEEAKYAAKNTQKQAQKQPREQAQAIVQEESFSDLMASARAERTEEIQEEAQQHGVNSHFSLVIPKIDAANNVVANVDPANEQEYKDALQKGIAHAQGTFFPGQNERIFLFAHSTDDQIKVIRYNAVFYLLRKLEPGDQIFVYFSDKKYVYQVEKKLVVPATEVSWLQGDIDREELVLQTCDPPGTTLNRLIVVATPIETN